MQVSELVEGCVHKNYFLSLSDGVVRSGTFLVIHSQLERLKTEGVVDVFQAIKSARIQRPGVIPNTVRISSCSGLYATISNCP